MITKVRSDRNTASLVQRLLLLVLLSSTALQANALSSDAQQPIQVEADNLEVRDLEKISIYSGNVLLIQGSIEFRGEQLTLYFNDKKELIMMKMTGAPATFRQLDDLQQELRGRGEKLEYRRSESSLTLIGDAQFTRVGDTINSNNITVDTKTGSLQAGSKDSEGRVRMVIQPKQE